MSRRVITSQLEARGGEPVDQYWDRVMKLIPGDIVAAWLLVDSLIRSAQDVPSTPLLWGAFIFGLIATALWTFRLSQKGGLPPPIAQTIISTIAFFVWVFALGGPFALLDWYRPLYGSLMLVGYSLVAPLFPLD